MSDTLPPDTARTAPDSLSSALAIIADELDLARDLAINGHTELIATVGALRESIHSTTNDLGDQMQRGFAMLAKMIDENKADTDAQIANILPKKYQNGHASAE